MKTILVSLATLLSTTTMFAQVGINTDTPKSFSLLDVESSNKGILIPRVSLSSTFDKQTVTNYDGGTVINYENSLLVYNTNTSALTGTSEAFKNVTPGFYYWETDRWIRMTSKKDQQFFYMPSIIIPTATDQIASTETFGVIDLYAIYKGQFSNAMVKNTSASTSLPIYNVNQLDYYITWYDDTVFSNVTVSDNGVMNYSIKPNADVTVGSFMNIIFAVK